MYVALFSKIYAIRKLISTNIVIEVILKTLTYTVVFDWKICSISVWNSLHYFIYWLVKKKPEGVQNAEEDCPVELRNIAAAIRLWGKLWSNISNVKICQSSCSALEEESKWLTRYFLIHLLESDPNSFFYDALLYL